MWLRYVCLRMPRCSWWVLSALSILGHVSWIDRAALTAYILECQDPVGGGISDRPGNMTDVFHTYFGIAGLSLLGSPNLAQIDPVYALPKRVVERLGLKAAYSTA
jgi:geranylgeranyl transferase type-2 subunit beta